MIFTLLYSIDMTPKFKCCTLKMKPLDESQRDSLLAKILRVGEKRKKVYAVEAAKELRELRKNGYDVDSYFTVFWSFIERYSLRL